MDRQKAILTLGNRIVSDVCEQKSGHWGKKSKNGESERGGMKLTLSSMNRTTQQSFSASKIVT